MARAGAILQRLVKIVAFDGQRFWLCVVGDRLELDGKRVYRKSFHVGLALKKSRSKKVPSQASEMVYSDPLSCKVIYTGEKADHPRLRLELEKASNWPDIVRIRKQRPESKTYSTRLASPETG
jgi:hypothetical protein